MATAIVSENPVEFPQGIILPSIFTFIYRGRKRKESNKLKKMKTFSKGIIVCAVPPAQGNSTWEGLKSCTRYFCQFPHLLLTVWNADLIVQVVKIMARGMQGQILTTVHGNPRARYTCAACCASAYTRALQRCPSPPPCWSWKPKQEQGDQVAAQSPVPGGSLGSLKIE